MGEWRIMMAEQAFALCRKTKDRSKEGGFRWSPQFYWGRLDQLAREGLDRLVAEKLEGEAKDFEQVKEAITQAKAEMAQMVKEYRDGQRREPVQAERAEAD